MSNSGMTSEGLAKYHHAPGKRSRVSGAQGYLIGAAIFAMMAVAIASLIARFY